MIKDIDKLIEKVKGYPNYRMVIADVSGYSVSYVDKMLSGERKLTMDFAKHLVNISKLMDKQKDKLEKEVKEALSQDA